jgi:hypothetical protein
MSCRQSLLRGSGQIGTDTANTRGHLAAAPDRRGQASGAIDQLQGDGAGIEQRAATFTKQLDAHRHSAVIEPSDRCGCSHQAQLTIC